MSKYRSDEEILADRATLMIYHQKWRTYCAEILKDDPEQIGRLVLAVLEYVINGVLPDFSDARDFPLHTAFVVIKMDLDQDAEKYIQKSRQNSKNVQKRWDNSNNTNDTNDTNVTDVSIDTNHTNRVDTGNGYGLGNSDGTGHGKGVLEI